MGKRTRMPARFILCALMATFALLAAGCGADTVSRKGAGTEPLSFSQADYERFDTQRVKVYDGLLEGGPAPGPEAMHYMAAALRALQLYEEEAGAQLTDAVITAYYEGTLNSEAPSYLVQINEQSDRRLHGGLLYQVRMDAGTGEYLAAE